MLPRQSLEVRPKTLSLPLSRREIGSSAETCHDSMSKYEESGLVNKAMFTKKKKLFFRSLFSGISTYIFRTSERGMHTHISLRREGDLHDYDVVHVYVTTIVMIVKIIIVCYPDPEQVDAHHHASPSSHVPSSTLAKR